MHTTNTSAIAPSHATSVKLVPSRNLVLDFLLASFVVRVFLKNVCITQIRHPQTRNPNYMGTFKPRKRTTLQHGRTMYPRIIHRLLFVVVGWLFLGIQQQQTRINDETHVQVWQVFMDSCERPKNPTGTIKSIASGVVYRCERSEPA